MSLLDALKPLFLESPLFVTDDSERKAFIEARKKRGKPKSENRPRSSKKLNKSVKVGQGGTLDPLADGILVVGLNKGTKSLSRFLECGKEYYTTAILGCETDTYDSDGSIVRTAPYAHVTPDVLREALAAFRGEISQLPPTYSALKMEGKPLYEYARNGLPLPRPIEARKVNVLSIELVDWQEAAPRTSLLELSNDSSSSSPQGHRYSWPEKRLGAEQITVIEGVRKLISEASHNAPLDPEEHKNGAPDMSEPTATPSLSFTAQLNNKEGTNMPPIFALKMTVSSGTYVRSIVHDLAHAVGSAAHVVSLVRTRQGDFAVGPKYPVCRVHSEEATGSAEGIGTAAGGDEDGIAGDCIPWEVFAKAIKLREEQPEYEVPAGEREEWEEMLLTRLRAS